MAELSRNSTNILLLVVFAGITSVFIHGYFPLSFSSTKRASLYDLPQSVGDYPLNRSLYRSHYSKTVLMVIDALRTDFLQQNNSMKYVQKLLASGEGCQLNVHVQAPTVTLPRVKSLTTGTVPNFIDVVLNFGSAAISIDSIIYQLQAAARKIVFLGDDTWVKLFPDSFTRQLENKDSLFVNDFYEGDKNITQRLNSELRYADWDLLVLHYLGLDHIGHVEGPFSGRIPGKLQEMDNVAMRIHLELLDWKRRVNLPSLFLVTGDHGMRDTGGHGGNSPAEVNVPLFVAGARCQSSDEVYEQIDIAPTLAVLLGLPIPESSIGSLIPEMLTELTEDEQMFALHYNGRRLAENIKQQSVDMDKLVDKEYFIQFNEATRLYQEHLRHAKDGSNESKNQFKRIKMLYLSSSREMSHQLATKFINYDNLSLAVGMGYATFTLLIVGLQVLTSEHISRFKIQMTTFSVLVSFIVAVFGTFSLCKCYNDSFAVCEATVWTSTTALMVAVLVAHFMSSILFCTNAKIESMLNIPPIVWFILLATIVHAFSLSSSSFIEEEHQTWYYLGKTLLVWLAAMDLWSRRKATKMLNVPGMGVDLSTRNLDASGLAVERWLFRNGENLAWICVLIAHAFLNQLNRTGDKWLSVPDIGDWLVVETNIRWHSCFVGAALLVLVYQCSRYSGVLTKILTLTASVLIYYYRTKTGAVVFAGFKASESTASVTVFWLNILEVLCINYVPVIYKVYLGTATLADAKSCLGVNVVLVSVVGSLLHKPHNIMLTGLLLMTCERVNDACNRCFSTSPRLQLFVKTVAHMWLANMFFFYQGNSNSLASIDLNAGYVGFKSFHFVQVAAFLTLNTYHAFFVSIAVLLFNVLDTTQDRQMYGSTLNDITRTITGTLVLPVTVFLYVAVAFRTHLFVWTVFSPKLIYVFFHLVLVSGTMLVAFLVNRCV